MSVALCRERTANRISIAKLAIFKACSLNSGRDISIKSQNRRINVIKKKKGCGDTIRKELGNNFSAIHYTDLEMIR